LDETLLEFGAMAACPPEDRRRRWVCPVCGARFSGDAHFCPFDGEPLTEATDEAPTADPLLGTVVDERYHVLRELGEGGMGTVYEVEHVALQRHFALKALRRGLARDESLAARFMQEANAAAAIAHPNIVQIADFGHLPTGEPYFVMELLGGVPLSRLIRESGPLHPRRAVPILRQISEALAAAHSAGIIHRDLKPDNIQICEIVGDRELVKVLDFGLAKVAGGSRLTRAGMVFGTPHYMSPEQAAGDPLDHRSDIYALGVVMYEMLTGRVPFEADTFMGVLSKHMYVLPAPPSEVRGAAAKLGALEQITLRCLQKKPAERFASMLEVLEHLERAVPDDERAGRRARRAGVASAAGLSPPEGVCPSEPSSEQAEALLRGSLSRGPTRVLALVLVAAAAVGAAAVAWRLLSSASAPTASASASAAALPGGPAIEPVRSVAHSGAAAQASPPVASTPSAAPTPPHAPSRGSGSSPRGAARRSGKPPASSPPSPTAHSPTRGSPRSAPRIGGGDIVNPWDN
jgi:serine/threonine protein kinase